MTDTLLQLNAVATVMFFTLVSGSSTTLLWLCVYVHACMCVFLSVCLVCGGG